MSQPPAESGPDPFANPWTRCSRTVAYDNPWITVYHDQVLRPDGQPGIYGMVHYKNKAVGVVPLDERDRVLLVGQYRYTLDRYSWEIPEGGAPAGEDLLEAAKRELAEETGYTAAHWQEILRAHLSNSVSDEEAICFLARDLTPGRPRPEETEQLQTRWVPLVEALAMATDGRITDALSVLGLQRLALLGSANSGGRIQSL
jgi:8-oxo-dGTP pyrophosphatase MutT (NUDIX family)